MTIGDAIDLYSKRGRYLRGLPDTALSERLVHWLNNCTQISRAGMVDLLAKDIPDYFQRLLDVMAETAIRHGCVSSGQDAAMWDQSQNVMIKPTEETKEKIEKILYSLPAGDVPLLLRFSSYEYMKELHETGGLLFQEASTFALSENLSVRDDELTLLMKRYIPKDELHLVPGAPSRDCIEGLGAGLNMSLSTPDFLVLCLTDAINFRMISDWNAEAVVVIQNSLEFRRRLDFASCSLLAVTGAERIEGGKVRYLDPYFPLVKPDVPFCKHFKFAYQREFRFVIRQKGTASFEQRKIKIGSLEDISSLVDLR